MRQKHDKYLNSAKELLIDLFENVINSFTAFDTRSRYKISAKEYADRANDRIDLRQQFYYLKKKGLIKRVIEGKVKYYELTSKGHKQIVWNNLDRITENRAEKWDKYFRIVMFDIPSEKNSTRDLIRRKLGKIGFIQMQKSVFVYPFECKKEIEALCYHCSASKYLKYMIAHIIEGEKEIIEEFVGLGILTLEDLR